MGFFVALALDASVAGSMAMMTGVCFLLALLFSPAHGLVAKARRLERQRFKVAMDNLLVHLFNHTQQRGEEHEAEVAHLSTELRWQPEFAQSIIKQGSASGLVQRVDGHLQLTDRGLKEAELLRQT